MDIKIIAPINSAKEVKEIIKAGASELYCGILPRNWLKKYTNIASPNRRDWRAANLTCYSELKEVVDIAHSYQVPVCLTLNAFYTQSQYPLAYEQVEYARKVGIDALIIADIGILLELKRRNIDIDTHVSTGGTTFNSQTARFYEEFGVSRIILPRHLQMREIKEIVTDCPSLKFEVFVLNSGCKNIDGFCTFQHGVNEILHPYLWNWFKKLNADRYLLEAIRRLPKKIVQTLKINIFGIDSACLLNYKVSLASDNKLEKETLLMCKDIAKNYNLLSGVDPCGACDLYQFKQIGMYAVKIVGRNYSTSKKVKDVLFLNRALSYLRENLHIEEDDFREWTKFEFKKIYKMNCRELCYRFN